jgi:alcohol dehydrogenase class IV
VIGSEEELILADFRYSGHAQDIVAGAGAASHLDTVLKGYGWSRILFLTSGSHERNGNADRVRRQISSLVAASFSEIRPHVQVEQVNEILESAVNENVDAIVALGGGSVIGMAKAVSDRLHEVRTGTLAREAHPLESASVPAVVLPTTYAGSEMTSVYGVTGPVDGVRRKITVSGRNIVPRVVVYDAELTLGMPVELTGTSAMNALSHCFEALYSPKRDPLSTAAALQGIRAIGLALPSAVNGDDELSARASLLDGSFLAGSALAQVQMAIHHGVCHVLGGTAGVPHGVANTIVLPHALRFNREVAKAELAEAAIILDLATRDGDQLEAADRVIEWVDNLGSELGLPKSLGNYGVTDGDVSELARIAMDGGPVQANPRPVASQEEMETFLKTMLWIEF